MVFQMIQAYALISTSVSNNRSVVRYSHLFKWCSKYWKVQKKKGLDWKEKIYGPYL